MDLQKLAASILPLTHNKTTCVVFFFPKSLLLYVLVITALIIHQNSGNLFPRRNFLSQEIIILFNRHLRPSQ